MNVNENIEEVKPVALDDSFRMQKNLISQLIESEKADKAKLQAIPALHSKPLGLSEKDFASTIALAKSMPKRPSYDADDGIEELPEGHNLADILNSSSTPFEPNMPTIPSDIIKPVTLDFLKSLARWVGWKYVGEEGKKRKVPITRNGIYASTTNSKTWMPYDETRKLEQIDGVGIVLGDLEDGFYLLGIDLDSCLMEDGRLSPFAHEVIERFPNSYIEKSPSGTGVKLFFRFRSDDIPAIRAALGKDSKTWKQPDGGDHGPAIELYLANRYFTVTERKFALSGDEVGIASIDNFHWLIKEFGPAFAAVPYDGGGSVGGDYPDQDGLAAPPGADVRAKAMQIADGKILTRDRWIPFGCALIAAVPDRELARDIFLEKSWGDRDYNAAVFDGLNGPFRVGWSHLCRLAMPDAADAFEADGEPPPPLAIHRERFKIERITPIDHSVRQVELIACWFGR